jgi:TIR domain-containing protein/WD40 domain-containing protein
VTLEGHTRGVTGCAVTPDGRRVVSASVDGTLKVWDLASGRAEATLEGHARGVTGCAVTPDGRWVVSASWDQTLKVWDLHAGACLLTHRANAGYVAIAATATAIIAGDAAGAVWFFDWPSPDAQQGSAQDDRRPDNQPTPSSDLEPPAPRPFMTKRTDPDEPTFDVFLSHSSRDKLAVRQLKAMVVKHELAVWLDEDQLQPGIPWQPLLERGIKSSRSVAVLIGNDGVAPWENEEMQAALQLAVRDGRPVIPVLLPGSTRAPELPLFLASRTWVDLRDGWTEEGMAKLIWGITGRKPRSSPDPR